jgi:ABC-type long-subunit fatty acid transport system fused permease/ATPase subunit
MVYVHTAGDMLDDTIRLQLWTAATEVVLALMGIAIASCIGIKLPGISP